MPPVKRTKLQEAEIIKCGSNPSYFINTYVKIPHPTRGIVKFDTYPFQDDCLEHFQNNDYNIIVKSRQLGISTLCAAYALWLCVFQKTINVLVIATKQDTAKGLIRKIRIMVENLPAWLMMPEVTALSTKNVEFSNGSKITAIPTSPDAGRGESVTLLIIDEAAYIEDFDDLWAGLQPTLTHGGKAIVLSSPAGAGGLFHQLWTKADSKENDFFPIKLMWWVHPDHDQAWFEKECRRLNNDPKKIAYELMCDFSSSGETFLKLEDIEYLMKMDIAPYRHSLNSDIWVWKPPVPEHKYTVGADVARGDSDDFSSFCIIDTMLDEVAAEYRGKIPADKYGELLFKIGTEYNGAVLCVEANQVGLVTLYKLRDMKYPKLFYEKLNKNPLYVDYYPEEVEGLTPGIYMTPKNRPLILAKFEEVIRNKRLKVYSTRLYEELKTFVWKGQKAQAMKGYHDDLVISYSYACWIYEMSEQNADNPELASAMLAAMTLESTSINTNILNKYGVAIMPGTFDRTLQTRNTEQRKTIPAGMNQDQVNMSILAQELWGWVLKN